MRNQLVADALFDALGDPMRRRIVERLRGGPMPVGALAEQLPVGRPAVSKHLRVLEDAGIVAHQSVGTRNLYALSSGGLAPLRDWLAEMWDERLAAFAAHVTATRGRSGATPAPAVEDPGGQP
jgi:DNA-binding transcriptional ArsR family regulator